MLARGFFVNKASVILIDVNERSLKETQEELKQLAETTGSTASIELYVLFIAIQHPSANAIIDPDLLEISQPRRGYRR